MRDDEKITLSVPDGGVERTYEVVISGSAIPQIIVRANPEYHVEKRKEGSRPRESWSSVSHPATIAAIAERLAERRHFQKALLYEYLQDRRWQLFSIERAGTDEAQKMTATSLAELPRPVFELREKSRLPKPLAFLLKQDFWLMMTPVAVIFIHYVFLSTSMLKERGLFEEIRKSSAAFTSRFAAIIFLPWAVFFALRTWEWFLEGRARKAARRVEGA